MRISLRCLLIVPALALASPAVAGEDTQYWQTLGLTVGLGGGFRVSDEIVIRTSEAKGLYEIENALMLGYKPSKQVTIAAGYVHDPLYSHGDFTVMEHRLRQQVSVDNFAKLGAVKFSARMRMEERWREGAVGTGWRLRPYLKASAPLVGKLTLNLTHESFVNLNTTGFQKVSGYDRMRNAIAVSAPLSKRFNVDLGYMNQLGIVRGGPDNMDHIMTVGLSASF
ncbi:MAG: DUF2490 domain-containing protein [Novosphingobium sp.]|uniref:DUF2490 domain-containing protein n=1 Tax=Novosphingobium sp. TaxID=1874826 RepID=UPI0017FF6BF0|nr:DUF2490 domain-containing protein [Novosphingobium sp.]